MTEQQRKFVRSLMNETRHPYEIAEATDSRLSDVRAVMRTLTEDLPGWGRLELQPFIVSRRRVFDPNWPIEDFQNLKDARRLHDQGRVNMCQGRDGQWIIQYAIPNQKPIRRASYFYEVTE